MYALLVLLSGLPGPAAPPATSCAADVQEIVTTVANESELAKWLVLYCTGKEIGLFFRYEKAVRCNKAPLAAVKFDFPFQQRRAVRYLSTASLAKRAGSAVITIESLGIDGKQATLKVRVPAEGVHGEFTLTKQDKWVIQTAHVFET